MRQGETSELHGKEIEKRGVEVMENPSLRTNMQFLSLMRQENLILPLHGAENKPIVSGGDVVKQMLFGQQLGEGVWLTVFTTLDDLWQWHATKVTDWVVVDFDSAQALLNRYSDQFVGFVINPGAANIKVANGFLHRHENDRNLDWRVLQPETEVPDRLTALRVAYDYFAMSGSWRPRLESEQAKWSREVTARARRYKNCRRY
jgi:hypothetical protein